ncbi:hypothetical protein EJ02DRAFT_516387 [Clathrospora elynae]|uniref:Uncharacterized protein n=1 Tax=Clathrospora elynae TaxID=706981 RepID=A0A6A5SDM2_9PLEO|nr:hypothetical protein EJ02DRAFT_516387 [Clathrospora elynae]
MAEEAKVVRQIAKEAREKDRTVAAAKLAASKAQKQQKKDAANALKAVKLSQRGKRLASQQKLLKNWSNKRVVNSASSGAIAEATPECYDPTYKGGSQQDMRRQSMSRCTGPGDEGMCQEKLQHAPRWQ